MGLPVWRDWCCYSYPFIGYIWVAHNINSFSLSFVVCILILVAFSTFSDHMVCSAVAGPLMAAFFFVVIVKAGTLDVRF